MDQHERMIFLLEEIAYRLSHASTEKEPYLEKLYARSQQSPTAIHGDVRPRPCACAGEMPQQEGSGGVLGHAPQGVAGTQVVEKSDDKVKFRYRFKRRGD